MLSTAWSRTDPFWSAWANDNPSWLRLRATAETEGLFSPEFLEQQRIELKGDFDREYLGIPSGAQASPFGWDLYERATLIQAPLVPAGPAFAPANDQSVPIVNPFRQVYSPEDVNSWPYFKPLIIAHDVGRSRDHSTAVVGGNSPCGRRLVGIKEAVELPQGLFGHARASSLAEVDRRHHNNALIVVDLSTDATYAETLLETFGQRVIGLQISRHGDGMTAEHRPTRHGYLPVYTIGRTYLLELLQH